MTLKSFSFTKIHLALLAHAHQKYAWMFDKSINFIEKICNAKINYHFWEEKRRRKNSNQTGNGSQFKKTNYVCTQVNLTHIQSKHCN